MSAKSEKKIRREIRSAGSEIYDEIKKQVNKLKLAHRVKIAFRIIAGRW